MTSITNPEGRTHMDATTPSPTTDRRRFLAATGLAGVGAAAAVALAPAGPAGASAPTDWRNVKVDHGAVGNGTGDDRAAIQAAIDAAAALGTGTLMGGVVWLPPGVYPIGGSLLMRTGVQLLGAGFGSVIQLKTGANVPAIVIESDTDGSPACYTTIRDLALNGATGTQHADRHGIAVRLNAGGSGTPSTGSDSFPHFSNLLVQYFGGHGIAVGINPPSGTADVRGFRMDDVIVWECAKAGSLVTGDRAAFYLNGTDGVLVNCMAAGNNGHGFHVVKANNSLTQCKAYFNYHEYMIQGNRTQLANCTAQDGFRDGYRAASVTNLTMTGCMADTNANAGVRLADVTSSAVTGLTSFVRGGGTSTGPGVQLVGTTSRCMINGTVNGFTTAVSGTNASGITDLVT